VRKKIQNTLDSCLVGFQPNWWDRVVGNISASACPFSRLVDNIDIDHIVNRHSYKTSYLNVSKFTSGEDLLNLVKIGMNMPIIRISNDGIKTRKLVEMGRIIGLDKFGVPTSKLFISINNNTGKVVTSFPAHLNYPF
jgi:hypothetical protein